MPIVTQKFAPDAASATAIAAAQAVTINVPMTLTALAAGPIDSSGLGRQISFVSSGSDGTVVFTIIGIDQDGNSITETVTGVTATPVVTTNFYSAISSITPSASTTDTISVGTNGVAVAPTLGQDFYARIATTVFTTITGTINYTVLEAFQDVFKPVNMGGTGVIGVRFNNPPAGLTSQTAGTHAQLDLNVTATQLKINSYSTGATITINYITSSNTNVGN